MYDFTSFNQTRNDLEVLMAKSTDEMFIGDLEECLRLAEELEKVDTEDTKLFVSEQLQKLHKFLQTKQIEVEFLFSLHNKSLF